MLQLLDPEGAAELLGCTAASVEDLLRAGVLPGLKFGRSWRIPAAALDARLNELALQEAAARRTDTTPAKTGDIHILLSRRKLAPSLT
jgi:excisionase family DNA binding protein